MKDKKVYYDSFTYNIVYYLRQLKVGLRVIKAGDLDSAKKLESFNFSHLIVSPGANSPKQAPLSIDAILHFAKDKRILGVCLGYQCIVEA